MFEEFTETEKILQCYFEDGEGDFLEECDLCHNFFDLQRIQITFNGYFYCDKYKKNIC